MKRVIKILSKLNDTEEEKIEVKQITDVKDFSSIDEVTKVGNTAVCFFFSILEKYFLFIHVRYSSYTQV